MPVFSISTKGPAVKLPGLHSDSGLTGASLQAMTHTGTVSSATAASRLVWEAPSACAAWGPGYLLNLLRGMGPVPQKLLECSTSSASLV